MKKVRTIILVQSNKSLCCVCVFEHEESVEVRHYGVFGCMCVCIEKCRASVCGDISVCVVCVQMLTIKLSEGDCFSAWVMGANVKLNTATPDLKCTYIKPTNTSCYNIHNKAL